MLYLFILGRNPELSRAEVLSYLEARSIKYREILSEENFLVLDFEANIDIQSFGGILKIGKVLFKGTKTNLAEFIEKDDLINEDKFNYAILGEDIEDFLVSKFKKEKRKAQIKRTSKPIKMQSGENIELPNADFHFFCFKKKDFYFGLIEQEYSYKDIKERDMKKPVRREELAISPRLAKILINLSQAKPGNLLLDPFCGVGGILQEALTQGIKCIGVDRDSEAIKAAKINLDWLRQKFKIENYNLINYDSAKVAIKPQPDAIATETALGELLRRKPNNQEAKKIIEDFEYYITPVLYNIKKQKKFNAKIAISCPFIREYSVNMQRICSETGLEIYKLTNNGNNVKFPIKEFREDQFISREIWVLV